MNKEEISLLRVMPTQERIRRFFPLLNARKINKPTYDYILSLEAHDPDPEGYWDGFHARLEISNDAGDSGGVIKKKSIRKRILALQHTQKILVPWNALLREWFPNIAMERLPPFSKEVRAEYPDSVTIGAGSILLPTEHERLVNY